MSIVIFGLVYTVTVLGLIFWGYTPSVKALQDEHDAKVFKEGFLDVLGKSFGYIEHKLANDDNAVNDEDLMLFAESIGYLDIDEDEPAYTGEVNDVDSDSGEERL